uniref:Uncharacterized protein n=1 Tax=Arundo donax TaxID=35708 RepID=A0A0A8YJ82_ARUDO
MMRSSPQVDHSPSMKLSSPDRVMVCCFVPKGPDA